MTKENSTARREKTTSYIKGLFGVIGVGSIISLHFISMSLGTFLLFSPLIITILSLFVGIEAIIYLKEDTRLCNLYRYYFNAISVFNKTVEDKPGLRKISNKDVYKEAQIAIYKAIDTGKEVTIIALIKNEDEVKLIYDLVEEYVQKSSTLFIIPPKIVLYTCFSYSFSQRINECLSKIDFLIQTTHLWWYYIPSIPSIWDVTVLSENLYFGITYENKKGDLICYSLENTLELSAKIREKALNYCNGSPKIRIFSVKQIRHLSALKNKLNSHHMGVFSSIGYNFGEHSDITTPDIEELFNANEYHDLGIELSVNEKLNRFGKKLNIVKDREARSYEEFSEELLKYESNVVSFWPLYNRSIHYSRDNSILAWQENLNKGVKENKVTTTRYLGYLCNPKDQSPIAKYDTEAVEIEDYPLFLEAVLYKFFYHMLDHNGYKVYLLPIDYINKDEYGIRLWDEIDRYLVDKKQCCAEIERNEIRKQFFLKDWILFNIPALNSLTMLQYDSVLDFPGTNRKVNLHKYLFTENPVSFDTSCSRIGEDRCIHENRIREFCCLYNAIVNNKGSLKPVLFDRKHPFAKKIANRLSSHRSEDRKFRNKKVDVLGKLVIDKYYVR